MKKIRFQPITKKIVYDANPAKYLKEHILRGDTSDGVPNFLSADNSIVDKIRQTPITKKKIELWVDQEPEDFCKHGVRNVWNRKLEVIDCEFIPPPMTLEILEQYKTQVTPSRSGLLNYFVKHRLKMLIEHIGDF